MQLRFLILIALIAAAAAGAAAAHPGPPPRPEVRASALQNEQVIDLALAPAGASQWVGEAVKEQLGNDMSAGDLNADGIADLFVGAHWWTTGGRNIIGRAYGVFGRPIWPAILDMASASQRGWSFTGRGLEARMGNAVVVGDLSGDGVDDAVMGSLLADPPDPTDSSPPIGLLNNGGAVYVVFGNKAAGGSVDFLNSEPDVYLAGNSGPAGADQLGTGLVVGDFNGDGHPDLAVAAVLRGSFTGAVFGWWGPLAKGRRIFLSQGGADWTIEGLAERTYLGASLAAGDLSGDGIDDLVVSAVDDDGTVGGAGAVYLFKGGPRFGKPVRRGAADADTVLVPAAGVSLGSAISLGGCSCKGQVMAVGDLTGDGAPDLLAGAPLVDRLAGEVLLLPGPLPAGRVDLAAYPHLTISAPVDDGRLGWSVAIGPLDDDGRPDLVLAAPWADVQGRSDAGLAFGLRGPLPGEGDLRLDPGGVALLVKGPQVQSGLAGMSIALADTDGDGKADLHLGFPDAAPLSRRSVGTVFRLPGPLLSAVLPSLTPSAAPATASPTASTPPDTLTPETPASATATDEPPATPTAGPSQEPTVVPDTPDVPRTPSAPPTVVTPETTSTSPAPDRRLWLPQLLRPRRR